MANEKDKQKQATSQKGTTYTQVNDSTYNWNAPTGYGVIHLDPNSGGPWGTYHVYQGSAGPDEERRLSEDGLAPHLQNINTLEFKQPEPWWQPIKDEILIPMKNRIAPKWNGLLDKAKIKKQGGYLTKYALGGATQQASSQEEEKGLITLIDAAYQEVASGKPGDSFVYVAQLLQDAEAMVKLDALKAKDPNIEDKLNAIEEVAMANSMYMKRGGCVKSKKTKVKKGAKGCVPCKKLMRIGGKLVNVLTDCEGNIISKHQAGGWIPKADEGTELLERRRQALLKKNDMNWLNQQDATVTANQKYYTRDGKLYLAKGKLTNGTWGWDTSGTEITGATQNNGVWSLNGQTINTVAHDALGTDYYTGATHQIYDPTTGKYFNYSANGTGWTKGAEATANDFTQEDYYEGTNMNTWQISPELAQKYGIDASAFEGPRPKKRGVYGDAPNSLLGIEARDPDGTDYINQYGVQGAWARENSIMRDKFRQAKQEKKTLLSDARATGSDSLANNDVSKSESRQAYRQQRGKLKVERANHAASIADAIRAKWAGWSPGVYTAQARAEQEGTDLLVGGAQPGGGNKSKLASVKRQSAEGTDLLVGGSNTVAAEKGGWLNKLEGGGRTGDLVSEAERRSSTVYGLPYEIYSMAKTKNNPYAGIQFTHAEPRQYKWVIPGEGGAYSEYTAYRDGASLPWDVQKLHYSGVLPAQPVASYYTANIPYMYPPQGGYLPQESPGVFMQYMVPMPVSRKQGGWLNKF